MKNINFGRQSAVISKKQSQFTKNCNTTQEFFRNKGQPLFPIPADKKMQGKITKK